MKRTVCVVVLAMLVAMVATAAFASTDNWKIELSVSSTTPTSIGGTLTVGAITGALDSKDGTDANQPPAPDPSISIYTTHPDELAAGANFRSDMRAPYTQGVKVWGNISVKTSAIDPGATCTLAWKRGTGDSAVPTGDIKLIRTDANPIDENDPPANDQYRVLDLNTDGSYDLFIPAGKESGVVANFVLIATIGNTADAPVPTLIRPSAGLGDQPTTSPVMDASGNIFIGLDNNRIYKYTASTGKSASIYTGSDKDASNASGAAGLNAVTGRIGLYGGNIYFVSGDMGNTVAKLNVINASTNAKVITNLVIPGSPCGSTPAPLGNSIYVGTSAGLTIVTNGTVGKTQNFGQTDLGTVFSPAALPGAAAEDTKVWVTTSKGNLYVASSNLETVVNSFSLGTSCVGSPDIKKINNEYVVVAAGGSTLGVFNSNGTAIIKSFDAGAKIDGPVFMTGDNRAFFATANGKIQGVDLSADPIKSLTANNFPVTLPTDSFLGGATATTPLDSAPVVYGDYLYMGAGSAGTAAFMVKISDGSVVASSCGDAATVSPTINPDAGKVAFGSRDGYLYLFGIK